jgi:hypothetical protein
VKEPYTRKPNTFCLICSKAIYKRPCEIEQNSGRVFCSMKCYGISCRKEKPCLVCQKPILAGLHKKTCSRACANIHRTGIQYLRNQPKNKVKWYLGLKKRLVEARGNECQICGYCKHDILQIHHKDKDRTNNSLANLELVCPNCHAETHYRERKSQ